MSPAQNIMPALFCQYPNIFIHAIMDNMAVWIAGRSQFRAKPMLAALGTLDQGSGYDYRPIAGYNNNEMQ